MDNINYFTCFIFGFISSTHCIGMCGGIISFLSLSSSDRKYKNLIYQFLYNFGRILSYSFIGLLVGFLGVFFIDYSNIFFIKLSKFISSFFIILISFYLLDINLFILKFDKIILKFLSLFLFFAKKVFRFKFPIKELFLGLIWGNLPCGLVYSALILSMSSGSVLKSAFLMFFFGLGTIPAIITAGTIYIHFKELFKNNFLQKISGFILLTYGILMFIKAFYYNSCHLMYYI